MFITGGRMFCHNIFNESVNKVKRRIESQTSRTAEYTCLARCLSYLEKREQYKSADGISLIIMNGLIRPLLHFSFFKRQLMRQYPAGMYEYVIARTKTIDSELKRALEQGFVQILIFGAGFDSRGIRFREESKNARIFELDAPVTQAAKLERFREKGIEVPESLVFVPIDFDRESLPDCLDKAGFKKGKPSLFILEGLTMYLQPESVNSTFKVIAEYAGPGSRVVFDHIYASVMRQENLYEGEREIYNNVAAAGERFGFGIEKGRVNDFLSVYGFVAEKILEGETLENMYFRDARGGLAGKVNKTHCIVTAVKA